MQEKVLTGYPSIDKPWLKYYSEGAEEIANDIPKDKTVWDVIEEKLIEYKDIPAIEYFCRTISRPEFIDMVYTWAKAFRAIGVKEDEIIAYYGPFFPDVGAMVLALNMIGACPYFLKLAISPEALAEETKECKIAIVFDEMWQNVSCEFTKDRFEKVIIINAFDGMSGVKKQVASVLSKLKAKSAGHPTGGKYYSVKDAKSLTKSYGGEVKAPFAPDRNAFITSSSGTTVGSGVKGVIATNESALAQLLSVSNSDIRYSEGSRILNHFPPAAATSLHSLFLLGLFRGSTILIDPRVSEIDFYNQLINLKPNFVINTSSSWELFFNRLSTEIKNGKKYDFSYATGWMIGGEGTNLKKLQKWNSIMHECHARTMYCGYGLSETFSGICLDNYHYRSPTSKQIAGVGLVQAGMTVGVFDLNGNELPYNQRGELWVKTKAAMKCYYNKPELTAKTKVDGWIHTGDLAEIDENGFVYIWGRLTDKVDFAEGKSIYLFDIANKIKEFDCLDDAIVLTVPAQGHQKRVVAHIVWSDAFKENEKVKYLTKLNKALKEYLPPELLLYAYAEHDGMLPYSPTTLKKDRNKMTKQTTGFYQVIGGKLKPVKL